MIWLRRFLAIFLAVLFLPIFLVTLAVLHVNSTVLSADFHVEHLRKSDIFNFLYNEGIPAAFDEVEQGDEEFPVDLDLVQDVVTVSLRDTFPPEWLQGQSEEVITQALPYLVGDTDEFAVSLDVAGRLQAMGETVKSQLGDRYEQLFDDVIAPKLEEYFQEKQIGDLGLGITIESGDIVEAVKEVVPPEWIHTRVEHVVDQFVPYLRGDSRHFALNAPVADRLEALSPALKDLLVSSNLYNVFTTPEFEEELDQRLNEFGELPFDLQLTGGQIASVIQEVAPPQWIRTQVETILDEMVAYLTGKQDGFELVIPLKGRIQAAVPPVKQLLRDVDAYTLLFDDLVTTVVGESLGGEIAFPFGVTMTGQEVNSALRDVPPPEFIRDQAEAMLDEVVPWVTGEQTRFEVVVPLDSWKEAAGAVIERLVDQKIEELAANLSACTVQESLQLVQAGFSGRLPSCFPKGHSLDEIKQEVGIDIPGITQGLLESQLGIDLSLVTEGVTLEKIQETFGIDVLGPVKLLIVDAIPDQYTFTDADLRDLLSANDQETLDEGLDWARNGYTYTDVDLREDLAGGGGDTSKVDFLDNLIDWGRNGITYTDADMREDVAGEDGDTKDLDRALRWVRTGFNDADLRALVSEDEESSQSFEEFDKIRGWFGLARSLRYLLLLPPMLLLSGIGLLGGRQWRSRAMWAAVVLGIAAGVAYTAFGPVYSGFADPFLGDKFEDATRDVTGVGLLFADMATDMARTVVGDFFSGLANRSLVLLLVVGAGLTLAIFGPDVANTLRLGAAAELEQPPVESEEGPSEPAGERRTDVEEPRDDQASDQTSPEQPDGDQADPEERGEDEDFKEKP